MPRTYARSDRATRARALVEGLQRRFGDQLEARSRALGTDRPFEEVEWLRDEGRHGGGMRRATGDTPVFDRGSVNVSQVHYDDDPTRPLASATALSTIIHPRSPHAPSIHMHFSWTELRDGSGYWRLMADLNPAIPYEEDARAFGRMLREAAPEQYEHAAAQGDRYFYIPALERHRGVSHFYLEGYRTDDPAADEALVRRVGEAAIDHYCALLPRALERHPDVTAEDRARQLEYHTIYLFQVLTLDRGTTSGLLVHDQNDVGIMGSLPSHVDRARLASWRDRVPAPQGELVDALVAALPDRHPSPVTVAAKQALAQAVRQHYRAYPEALALQAAGDVIPPTVANHGS
ncbi:MAG: coproporphyrinogen III oxidase [Myxococcales bacterium]|nr:coproporphyrinogen III oxidase [Myxococcales bacterium]